MKNHHRLIATGLLLGLLAVGTARAADPKPPATVDFSRQIRPILADNCFACHGPDEKARKAKLRLDIKDGVFRELRSGNTGIVPGKPAESELYKRLVTEETHELMPPVKSTKRPTPAQIALVKRWIEEGANWTEHWAFVAPKKAPLPRVSKTAWIRNPVDQFILARLEEEGLEPTTEADRVTLLRRLSLDLTGLPPTPEEVDAFLKDTAADAYEKQVDRLLASPRFGEHMARFWLDAARYGDTHGLHLDNYREMWAYRDWVVRAFNGNKTYDRFLIEQIAGDLLPDATLDNKVASGFNRCHITTSEGGSIAKECYVRNVTDRVDTFGTVVLGLSTGCARCHDHKFDPLTMKDYYQFFAYFNSLDDNPLDGNAARHEPAVRVPTPEQAVTLEKLSRRVAELRKQIADEAAKIAYDDSKDAAEGETPKAADYVWIDEGLPAGAKPALGGANKPWEFVGKPQHPAHTGAKSARGKATGLSQLVFEQAPRGLRVGQGDKLFAYAWLDPKDPPRQIMLQWNTGSWMHRAYWGENLIDFGRNNSTERKRLGPLPKKGEWVRLEVDAAVVGLTPGMVISGWAFTQHGGTVYWDNAGLVTRTPQADQPFDTLAAWVGVQKSLGGAGLPAEIAAVVKTDKAKRSPEQQKQLRDYFVAYAWSKTRKQFEPMMVEIAAAEREREAVERAMPSTLVSKELPKPKPAYLLKRGEYDQEGAEVGRGIPSFLPPLPAKASPDRLGLAQWLVTREHPLTARVQANRLWQQVFGVGLVKTAEEFGSQGEAPSHPELLDWLAVQFIDDGWDTKVFVKRLVTSAAYRQSARTTKDRLAKDPENRLLSRGPRFRLDAETLRDQALFVSGLLVEKMGGPSVKPPQPSGLWEAVGYTGSNTARFKADAGKEKVHRRSLYTFWKRTSPPPQMTAFDAPSREACAVRRERTNTPLQALLLLNETQYVEAARGLAERGMREGGTSPETRVTYMFRLATGRKPDARELSALMDGYRAQLEEYTKDTEAARKLISVGETKPDPALDPAQLAATTMIGNVLLNLDEVLNK